MKNFFERSELQNALWGAALVSGTLESFRSEVIVSFAILVVTSASGVHSAGLCQRATNQRLGQRDFISVLL